MGNSLIIILISVCVLCSLVTIFFVLSANKDIKNINKTLTYQYNLMVKIQTILKNKFSVNETTDKAEMLLNIFGMLQ